MKPPPILVVTAALLQRSALLCAACIVFYTSCFAFQPANDNCTNASVIDISNNGFGLGKFNSAKVDITASTVQPGETFVPEMITAYRLQGRSGCKIQYDYHQTS